jgi:hypothetical protein
MDGLKLSVFPAKLHDIYEIRKKRIKIVECIYSIFQTLLISNNVI